LRLPVGYCRQWTGCIRCKNQTVLCTEIRSQ